MSLKFFSFCSVESHPLVQSGWSARCRYER